jgi:hypothetical protein
MHNPDDILKLANDYYNSCHGFVKEAVIKALPNGKYRVLSETGKNLGTFPSKDLAKKRLKQVEYFKYLDRSDAKDTDHFIDLTKAVDFSYSAIMRELRQNASKEQVMMFLKLFKVNFDKAVKEKMQKPEKVGLQNAIVKFDKLYKIKLDKKLIKNAAVSELGDAAAVGKYLSDIVKFTLSRIAPDKRAAAMDNLRKKLYHLNENEIAMKQLPPSSSLGQSITFVKHVLFNQDSRYVREVLNNIVRNLQ